MKHLVFIALLLISVIVWGKKNESLSGEKMAPDTNEPAKWELVWEDNFDVAGLPDSKIWSYEEGYVRNGEAQYYTKGRAENARVENGNLIIEARSDNWNGHKITAASINTYGKKSILYGRVEVKAKLPTGVGTWPAIWMLGDAVNKETGWPAGGEIDIMENVGYDPDVIHANIHTKAYNHVKKTNKGNKITIAKPYNDFHIYAIEWFDDHMDFFVDDKKYFTFQNEKTGNDAWPFDKPHYLLINLAIGGAWGGEKGVDEKIFPQKYYIDYVKVFKQK